MTSGGTASPWQGPRLVSGGGKGVKSPESLKILHFALPKIVKNSKISDDGSRTLQPLGYKPSALATELNSSKVIAGKELSLSSWCLIAISFELFSSVARSSVITKELRVRVSPSASSLYISLLVSGVPVPSRTTVLLG